MPTESGSTNANPSPTGASAASATAQQKQIAAIAEEFYHAVGNNTNATICRLVDPADLKALLKKKNIPSCSRLIFTFSAADEKALTELKIDPSKVLVLSTSVLIPESGYTPSSIRTLVGLIGLRRSTPPRPGRCGSDRSARSNRCARGGAGRPARVRARLDRRPG